MGVVYSATDTKLNRAVAVKLLRHDFATWKHRKEMAARFEREAMVTAGINDIHCVRLYDAGVTEHGTAFLVMELLDGEDLDRYLIARKQLPLDEALHIFRQMLYGLGAAHDCGVIHRDLKPSNVFLTRDRRGQQIVKLVDFGIAAISSGPKLTEGRNVVGTLHYLAPELLAGEQASPRSDLYACGLILFEMLAGRSPYDVENDLVEPWLNAHLNVAPHELADFRPELSQLDRTQTVLTALLAKPPQDRPANVQRAIMLVDELEQALLETRELQHASTSSLELESEAAAGAERAGDSAPTPSTTAPQPEAMRRVAFAETDASEANTATLLGHGPAMQVKSEPTLEAQSPKQAQRRPTIPILIGAAGIGVVTWMLALHQGQAPSASSPQVSAVAVTQTTHAASRSAPTVPVAEPTVSLHEAVSAATTELAQYIRPPQEPLVPFLNSDSADGSRETQYATALTLARESVGVVVTSRDGRPVSIKGNPKHPISRGASDLWLETSLLRLFDPKRLRTPMRDGAPVDLASFDKFMEELRQSYAKNEGAGLYFLTTPTNSPSYVRARQLVIDKLPKSRIAVFAPGNDSNARLGARLALGAPVNTIYDFARAAVVVALDSDFLGNETGSVLYRRQFESAGTSTLYAIEPTLSVTGARATRRIAMSGRDISGYLSALISTLAKPNFWRNSEVPAALKTLAAEISRRDEPGPLADGIEEIALELLRNRNQSLIVVGPRQPPPAHAAVALLNDILGNRGKTVTYTEPADPQEPDNFDSLATLVKLMNDGKVDTLFILGGDPIADAPADLGFSEAMRKVRSRIHLTTHTNQTSMGCSWQVPHALELESWGDQQSSRGDYAIQQPVVSPLWEGRTDAEVLAQFSGEPNWRALELTQAMVHARGLKGEPAWKHALEQGLSDNRYGAVLGSAPLKTDAIVSAFKVAAASFRAAAPYEVVFALDNLVYDGSLTPDPWLLAQADPITAVRGDNPALLAPETADALGVADGDTIELSHAGRRMQITARRQQGVAKNSVILKLGWGRIRSESTGQLAGTNVSSLRSTHSPYYLEAVGVQRTGPIP